MEIAALSFGLKYHLPRLTESVFPRINNPKQQNTGITLFPKSQRPETPIIALTGAPWQVEGKAVDFDKVLEKPFLLQSLAATVKALAN